MEPTHGQTDPARLQKGLSLSRVCRPWQRGAVCRDPARVALGAGARTAPATSYPWLSTDLGTLKNALHSTDRAVVPHHLLPYPPEVCRRFGLTVTRPRHGWAAVHTPPRPQRLDTSTEARWQSGGQPQGAGEEHAQSGSPCSPWRLLGGTLGMSYPSYACRLVNWPARH